MAGAKFSKNIPVTANIAQTVNGKTNAENTAAGKTNNATNSVSYHGKDTDTAKVLINNEEGTIAVDVLGSGKDGDGNEITDTYANEVKLEQEGQELVLTAIAKTGRVLSKNKLAFDLLKAKGMYHDIDKEFDPEHDYWYLTSEIDDEGYGTKESVFGAGYDLGAGGGGGGGGGATEVTLTNVDPATGLSMWPTTVALNTGCNIGVYWTSKKRGQTTGPGTLSILVNGKRVLAKTCMPNDAANPDPYYFNIAQYMSSGDNTVQVTVTDMYSTSETIVGIISAVELSIESNFDYTMEYAGTVPYKYTPYGSVTKTVKFIIDEGTSHEQIQTQTVKTTAEQQTKVLSGMSHGAHTLRVYFEAKIDGSIVRSNELFYEIIVYQTGNKTPIIASEFRDFEQTQYSTFNIHYRVYTPGKDTSEVKLLVNGEQVGTTLSVGRGDKTWAYRSDEPGTYEMTIQTGTVTKTFEVHIAASTLPIEPITTELELFLNALNRNNDEKYEDRIKWEDKERGINCTLSGFNWASNGWMKDDEGVDVLRIAGSAHVTINDYYPFKEDFKKSGKTFEFEIATRDVKNYDAVILSCLLGGDDVTKAVWYAGEDTRTKKFDIDTIDKEKFIAKVGVKDKYLFVFQGDQWTLNKNGGYEPVNLDDYGITLKNVDLDPSDPSKVYIIGGDKLIISYITSGKGIYLTPQLAKFQAQQASISTQYKEDDHVRLTFVVEDSDTESRLINMYINGILSGVVQYPKSESFTQSTPQLIQIGSADADATIDVYNIRVYNMALNRKQVVTNWIADTNDNELKINRYVKNDNFDDLGQIDYRKLPQDTPYMILTGEKLPEAKKDKQTVQVVFVYPSDSSRDFTAIDATADVQGTSSQSYFRKNFKINYKNGFYNDMGEWSENYHITPTAKKEHKFTYKADVASSEGTNNVELVRYFEDTKNFLVPPEKIQDPEDTEEGLETKDRIRVGIDGFPIVMFHRKKEEDVPEFYGKMNFNNDKDNKRTFGFQDGDECWEFIMNSSDQVLFKSANLTEWDKNFESRYPETYGIDEHPYGTGAGELDKLQAVCSWVVSTRVLDSDTAEEKAAKLAKFKNELSSYYDVTSALFYYLYTELFLMVDSRAKNAMMCYYKSRQLGDGGDRWFWIPYDMDTALGINNEGLLVFDYDAEDTDLVNGAYVFNGQDSTFWNNIRMAFPDELNAMYVQLRTNAWSFDSIEKYFEDHQSYWSENIFNEDSYFKYIVPLINELKTDFYLGMCQGSKEQQRRWWLANRFKYLDAKYRTGDASKNEIFLRAYEAYALYKSFPTLAEYLACYDDSYGKELYYGLRVKRKVIDAQGTETFEERIIPANELRSDEIAQIIPGTTKAYTHNVLDITPFINCYVTAIFDQNVNYVTEDGERNNVSRLIPPSGWDPGSADSVMKIWSGDLMRDVGDLSDFKVGQADFSKATKLQKIKLGRVDRFENENYSNGKLEKLTVGNNRLLTEIDCRNCINLSSTVELENCVSLEYAYFNNTQITSCSFPVGGYLKEVALPASITSLVLRDHPNMQKLTLAGTDHLDMLWLENIPSSVIDAYTFVTKLKDGCQTRITGIDQEFADVSNIKTFYDRLDKLVGLDHNGSKCPINEAIAGTIHIANIPYKDYVELSDRYQNITIDAEIIWCTANFMIDDEQLYVSYTLPQGGRLDRPTNPQTVYTPEFARTFVKWDFEFPEHDTRGEYVMIEKDMTITASWTDIRRNYTINYHTNSPLIDVEPTATVVPYGSIILEEGRPVVIRKPDSVRLRRWYYLTADDTKITFYIQDEEGHEATKITSDVNLITTPGDERLELYAEWIDEDAPEAHIIRKNYKTFEFHLTDNVGLTKWACTKRPLGSSGDPEEPAADKWLDVPVDPITGLPRTDYRADFDIVQYNEQGYFDTSTLTGIYYLWTKDDYGNTVYDQISCFAINRSRTPSNCATIKQTEGEYTLDAFALAGTQVKIEFEATVHYYPESVQAFVNMAGQSIEINSGYIATITDSMVIVVTAVPRTYRVMFDVQGRGTAIPDQYIVYDVSGKTNHAEEPNPQPSGGYYIKSWHYDAACESEAFNFKTTPITGDMILYANWQQMRDPHILTVHVPAPGATIKFYVTTVADDTNIEVSWGDGETAQAHAELANTVIELAHTFELYPDAFDYIVKIKAASGSCVLGGGNESKPVLDVDHISWLTSVIFPSGANGTANYAFSGATGLTTTGLNAYMTQISDGAYQGCTGLMDLQLNKATSLTTIGLNAFVGCTGLSGELLFPDTLSSIGRDSFRNCTGITKVVLPEKLTILGSAAFAGCANLTIISIPDDLHEIQASTFEGCESLTSLTLNVESIGNYAFRNCISLEKLVLTNPSLQVGTLGAFSNCARLKTAGPLGANCNIEFAWTTAIPDYAFCRHSSLEAIIWPAELTTIGSHAFDNCRQLYSQGEIRIPQTVISIEDSAFLACRFSTAIILNTQRCNIDKNAFASASYLEALIIYATSSTISIDEAKDSWVWNSAGLIGYQNAYIKFEKIASEEEAKQAFGVHFNTQGGSPGAYVGYRIICNGGH